MGLGIQYESMGRTKWKWKILSAIRDLGSLPKAVEKCCPEKWQIEVFYNELNEGGFFYDQVEGALKAFFLREYPKHRDIGLVCKVMWWTATSNIYPEAVMGWCDPDNTEIYDPIFEGKFARLRKQIEAAQKLRSTELVGPALDVYEQELHDSVIQGATEQQRDRGLKAATKVLTGTKVLDEAPAVAIDQSKKTINIIVADAETKDLMERAKERLLGNGD